MIDISLTQFVDFVMKVGTPQLTAVRKIKRDMARGYHPSRDFYRKMREGIIEYHKLGKARSALDALVSGVHDKNKAVAYPLILKGYKRFLGRKKTSWIDPQKRNWRHGELLVNVNPELGLEIDGEPHLVKMYFKKDPPSKIQVTSILHLMQLMLRSKKGPRKLCLLDVRQGRLIPAPTFDARHTLLLEGQAEAFAHMYERL